MNTHKHTQACIANQAHQAQEVCICQQSGLGRQQRAALEFITRVWLAHDCNADASWHSFAADVRRPIVALARRGLVEVSLETRQFRLVA